MSTKPKKVEEFTEILNVVKDHFKTNTICSIHNFLWQTIVNRVHAKNKITLYSTIVDGKETLVKILTGKKGYINTGVEFKASLPYDVVKTTVDFLNKKLFNQTPDESHILVAKSFQ